MAIVLRFLPSANALAVYDTATPTAPDDAAMFDPLGNISRVKFHSGLTYPAFIPGARTTGNTVVPGQSANTRFNGSVAMFAHGRGEVPVLFGRINSVSGATLAGNTQWHGTVALTVTGGRIFVSLGADASNVIMRYYGWTTTGTSGGFGAVTISYTVDILDATISGTNQFAGVSSAPQLELLGNRITAGRRKFDTDRTYMRANLSTNTISLARGATMATTGTLPAVLTGSQVNTQHLGLTYGATSAVTVGY